MKETTSQQYILIWMLWKRKQQFLWNNFIKDITLHGWKKNHFSCEVAETAHLCNPVNWQKKLRVFMNKNFWSRPHTVNVLLWRPLVVIRNIRKGLQAAWIPFSTVDKGLVLRNLLWCSVVEVSAWLDRSIPTFDRHYVSGICTKYWDHEQILMLSDSFQQNR